MASKKHIPLSVLKSRAKHLNALIARRERSGNRAHGGHDDGVDEHAATELDLFIENDGDIYRQQGQAIQKNLANKMAQGKYDHAKAVKLMMYMMDNGAKKYAKEFAQPSEWNRIFSVATRKKVAERFAHAFETEYKLGNYDHYLTKVSLKKRAASKR